MEGLCAISVMLHYPSSRKSINPLTPDPASINNIDILKPRDIVERYKEIVIHYSKFRLAGVIETEASIKAVQVLIEQRNFVLAAEFLQNLVFINLNMNDEEKIHRFISKEEMLTMLKTCMICKVESEKSQFLMISRKFTLKKIAKELSFLII